MPNLYSGNQIVAWPYSLNEAKYSTVRDFLPDVATFECSGKFIPLLLKKKSVWPAIKTVYLLKKYWIGNFCVFPNFKSYNLASGTLELQHSPALKKGCLGLFGSAEELPFGLTENGLASKKRSVSAKFPIANGLIITVKIMLMTMMMIIMIITIEKGEAYHLVPKSILLLNIRVIWKVNTALDLVQSFELNNDG